jgi:phosphoribosylformylglycinamidine cyclo-ligase
MKAFKDPLLVSATDGVGTKLDLALAHNDLTGVGQDLVAMCVNDLYTLGAEPLFFLDYYVTESLQEEQFRAVLASIKKGLHQCQCVLLGGETAEHPGVVPKGHLDLAGFVVGIVDGDRVLGPDHVRAGDQLFALPSSGFHSNGFSLIRRWLEKNPKQITPELIKRLLAPTKIYHEVPKISQSLGRDKVKAWSHITGGGISGNLTRVIPKHLEAKVRWSSLRIPEWMQEFIKANQATPREVEGVFNLGAGMIGCVSQEAQDEFMKSCQSHQIECWHIGEVEAAVQDGGLLKFV